MSGLAVLIYESQMHANVQDEINFFMGVSC